MSALQKYLLKIDHTSRHADAYLQIACYAVMNGSITISDVSKSKTQCIDKWSVLRKLIKTHVYKTARLQPRPSDADFDPKSTDGANGLSEEHAAMIQEVPQEMTDEEIIDFLSENKETFEKLVTFVQKNAPAMPLASHVSASTVANKVMMALMPKMVLDHQQPLWVELAAEADREIHTCLLEISNEVFETVLATMNKFKSFFVFAKLCLTSRLSNEGYGNGFCASRTNTQTLKTGELPADLEPYNFLSDIGLNPTRCGRLNFGWPYTLCRCSCPSSTTTS